MRPRACTSDARSCARGAAGDPQGSEMLLGVTVFPMSAQETSHAHESAAPTAT